jgi:hypothetical protein
MIVFFKKRRKTLALFFASVILGQVLYPPTVYALTGGPTQPEVQSFTPAGVSDMVDLFSGDFGYNIPLFELPGPNGGYPFNLSYQSGIGMDQEASWVGLGWSLQPGAITRQMRGLPDEFNGDFVNTKMSIEPSVTVGLGAGVSVEIFGGAAELGVGFSVYSNNYSGAGYSIDASLGFSKSTKGGMTGGLGVNVSLDSREGVSVSPSLSLGGEYSSYSLGAGYNSKQGLTNVSLTSTSKGYQSSTKNAAGKDVNYQQSRSSTASLSLAHPGYTPQITMPMNNLSLSATLKLGVSWWGIFGSPYVSGFYNEQKMDSDKKNINTKGYGYMNYQNAGDADLLDYNREKDGMVSGQSPNLAIPSLTYDIYSVTGQGIGMMYRPVRNDYGVIYDQKTSSVSNAIGVGADIGPAATHIGVNLDVQHSQSTTGKWSDDNFMLGPAQFQQEKEGEPYEPWYFKVHGEPSAEDVHTLANIGGDDAVKVRLEGTKNSPNASVKLEKSATENWVAPANSAINRQRKPRPNAVQSITNAELLDAGHHEVLTEYMVNYVNEGGSEISFDRSGLPNHHFAGYTALNPDGLRYVYGIPAYNNKREEVTFSAVQEAGQGRVKVVNTGEGDPKFDVSYTQKFLKKIAMPKFAHSYLLTSVLGPDYVDLTNNGVTDDDLGYWVKFTYKRTASDASGATPYKWRDPYTKAHLVQGWKTDPRDDKGTYTYGEKELWYLARAETRSHIARFTMEPRSDARGANSRLQDNNSVLGASVYLLRKIELYTRAAGPNFPIKVTKFDYDYSLCTGAENSVSGGGKLTLKRLWFEYGNSSRGTLNPYTFNYNNQTSGTNIAYDVNAYDRWGNYKPYPAGDPLFNQDFPYVTQDPSQKTALNAQVAAWSLNEIKLPSGGLIQITYESDEYAYVQNKPAQQMMETVNPYTNVDQTPANVYMLDHNNYKVRFKLERSITDSITNAQQKTAFMKTEVMKYLGTESTVYCKMKMNLRKPGEDFYEYVGSYIDIDFDQPMLLERQSSAATAKFVYGSFYVKGSGKHPFSIRAWQHLRINQPDLTNSTKRIEPTADNNAKVNQIKGLTGMWSHIKEMFKGFNDFCDGENWGEQVVADRSWIRLNSPDKIKYGGGLRVKQLTMKDQWSGSDEGVYGQVYEYATVDESGKTISSGVAAYEPIIGGEENPLHQAKKYVESIPMLTKNNLFFEYPVNESYYPAAHVGYSKVTVMSLPSAVRSGRTLANSQSAFPTPGANVNFGSTGKTEHEFYTAKDFPVITDETEKGNLQDRYTIPIPFIGAISADKLATNQGYSIVTNDMHGKQKKVTNYRQNRDGSFDSNPISWVAHNYLSEQRVSKGQEYSALTNVLKDNEDGTLRLPTAAERSNPSSKLVHFGQETEMFHDMRQFEDKTWGGGARYNTDIVYIPVIFAVIPIPVPMVWPSISTNTVSLKMTVTNKIIFRSGILVSTEAFDEGSKVVTSNLKWDKLTGAPLVTTLTNDFGNPIYSYSLPAFHEYQGMGAAYQNIGLTFSINSVQKDPIRDELYQFFTSLPDGTLRAGDELLLYDPSSQFETPLTKVVYTGKDSDGDHIVYTEHALTAIAYRCMIVRSGFRNQLSVMAGTTSGLSDPSEPGTPITYSKTITLPK